MIDCEIPEFAPQGLVVTSVAGEESATLLRAYSQVLVDPSKYDSAAEG